MDLDIDLSEWNRMLQSLAHAPEIVDDEMLKAGRQAGFILQGQAVTNAPVGKNAGGNLRAGIGPPEVERIADGVKVTLTSHAKYSKRVEDGHGVITPKRAKALRFTVGGQVVFTKRVRAVAGRPFLKPALTQTKDKTARAFELAIQRAAKRAFGGNP
jgi:hypothetical protein